MFTGHAKIKFRYIYSILDKTRTIIIRGLLETNDLQCLLKSKTKL
jgi:hypothetical protein